MRVCWFFLVPLAACAPPAATNQAILIATTPPFATCTVSREGQVIAQAEATPQSVVVQRDKHDLSVRCTKPGYQPAEAPDKSGVNPLAVAQAIGGGLFVAISNSAQGTDNAYTTDLQLNLPAVQK